MNTSDPLDRMPGLAFCPGPLWNTTQTWDTDEPDFTACFHKTVLVYVPCAFLWLLSGLELRANAVSNKRFVRWSWVNLSKLTLDTLLVAFTVVKLSFGITVLVNPVEGKDLVQGADFVAQTVFLVTFLLDFALVLLAKRAGRVTSGCQFIFWLLLTLSQGLYMGSVVRGGEVSLGPDYHILEMIVVCFVFALTVLNLIVHCFADKTPIYTDIQDYIQNLSPETTSSFVNRVLFLWFDKTVWKSRNKTIDFPDLWSLNPEDQIDKITSDWDRLWEQEMERSRLLSRSPRILRVLFKAHWSSFLFGAIIQLLYVMLQFVNPLLLNLIISFVEGDEPYWRGFLYTAILSVSGLIAAIADSQYWYKMSMIGFRVKTALSIAIYKKALVLSSSSRKEKTAGELVNMINVDCQKIIEASVFMNIMWSSPMQVGISIYLLYQTIGVAIFVGLAVLIILFPVNSVIWAVMSKYQASQMKLKDSRVKLISEIMSGIKVIKLFAWELPFIKRINKLRLNEVNQLKVVQFLEGTQYFVWSIAPLLVALLSFMSYVLIDPVNNVLDTQTAFVSMTLFNTIRGPLFMLPYGIVSLIQAIVSLRRINAYFDLSDLDKNSVSHDEDSPHPISFKKASFKWNEKETDPTILNDISLDVHDGALVAVVGKVGAGKSSLISALLGEMTRSEGEVNIRGRVAYVPQQAWIRNETLKNNILFGKNFNGDMYKKVIEACALKPDLEILNGGDETEIGEKGINLSGGQKQRVSLARAVYNNADIYLLDDPLSAVDSNVGKHIFDKVIGPKGALRRKTRILVTHGIAFLPYVDQIVVLKDGRISESGTYEELMRNRGAFAEFLMDQLQEYDSDSSVSESEREDLRHKIAESLDPLGELANSPRKSMGSKQKRTRTKTTSISSFGESYASDQESILSLSYPRRRRTDSTSVSRQTSTLVNDPREFQVGRDLIEDEEAETKGVKIEVYIYYTKALGLGIAATSIFLYALFQGCNIGGNFWLSIWAADEAASTDSAVRNKYIGVYGALGFMQSMSVLVAVIVITIGTLRSSVKLHKELLEHILMSTMSFFDTTPLGRIINRFSKDIDEVDLMIPTHIKDILTDFFSVIGTLFVVTYASPIILTLVVPLIIVFFFIQNAYLSSSRQLKRMVSVSTSPINSSMTESFNGAATIRAYKVEGNFIKENNSRVELNQRCYYPENVSDSWLFSRLESLANLLIIFTSLFSVIYRDTMDPGLTGMALTYTFTFQLDIYLMTRYFAELEKSIVSVERIREYQQTETEAAFEKPESDPPQEWPESGKIEFDNYQTRYRTGLDLVLKGVSFKVIPGEKVGIVGRTGAGKSSLTLALFRLIEASGGRIKIDDIDIAELGLMRLRSALTIIPQEPLLFSGTLRLNLDPFEKYTDAELWVTLEHAHLKIFVENLSDGLDYEIIEGGENLSVGQRQLVCLARALLRKTKILVLDEATAAVDLETDDLIQATIRSEFNDCTVLTIAHRLKTIMDNDKIILLDNGMVKEFDTPENLLRDKASDFHSMAKDAGLV